MLERPPIADAGELADLWLGALDAEGAAKFIGYSKDAFKRAAPTIPRYPGPNGSHRYLRSDLLAWLKGRGNAAETGPHHTALQGTRKKREKPRPVEKRLI